MYGKWGCLVTPEYTVWNFDFGSSDFSKGLSLIFNILYDILYEMFSLWEGPQDPWRFWYFDDDDDD